MLDSTPQNRRVFASSQEQGSERATFLPVIPIYLLHTPEKPFCSNDHCACHQNQSQIAVLLQAVKDGEMTLREAANFTDGKTF